MIALRKVLYYVALISGASVCGLLLGLWFVYGNNFLAKIYQDPRWEETLAANVIDKFATSSTDGFYKPLRTQQIVIPQEGKMVHADLAGMKIFLYENGEQVNEFPIVSKGKPGSFWETPTGEYRVLSRETTHFSSIGSVWMPYSIGFFGNFFIHGWPTYPSGEPVPEGFSGGCIRMNTDDAEKIYTFVAHQTPVIVTDVSGLTLVDRGYVDLRHQKPPQVSAQAFLIADLDNQHVFLERDRETPRSIASVTKLMTGVISLEAINQEKEITITDADVAIYGNGELKAGETYLAKDLLSPLMLPSSNDAAYAIARTLGIGHFVNLMNKKAEALHLAGTHFSDPSGLERENMSTPEDLLYLLRYVRDVRTPLLNLTRKPEVTFETELEKHTWKNVTWRKDDPRFIGGKIGYTDASGQTLVGLFRLQMSEFETRDIGVVVLGSQGAQQDVETLVSWVKANFIYGNTLAEEEKNTKENKDGKVSLLFVGDIMMDRGIRKIVEREAPGNYLYMYEYVKDALASRDITFGNLEGPISDRGTKAGSIYSFRMDPKATDALSSVGFDIVSVSNNHMGDYGREAFDDTLSYLKKFSVAYTGGGVNIQKAREPTLIERNGIKIGFLGFSDVGPSWMAASQSLSGIALADREIVSSTVLQAKSKADILVVSFHFGEEYQTRSSARQQELARTAIDAGAKIVAGHHPHVAQEIEKYKDGVIAYSFGNFIFDQAFSEDTKKALAMEVIVDAKNIISYKEIPVIFKENYRPTFQ